jgi:hypothetical protein
MTIRQHKHSPYVTTVNWGYGGLSAQGSLPIYFYKDKKNEKKNSKKEA